MYDLCIIGFGVSGICCAKWAEKYNLKYIVLEKESYLGGVWFTKAMDSTSIQSPKNFINFLISTCQNRTLFSPKKIKY